MFLYAGALSLVHAWVVLWPIEIMVETTNKCPESNIFESEYTRDLICETKGPESEGSYSETEGGGMREISANNNKSTKLAELTMEDVGGKTGEPNISEELTSEAKEMKTGLHSRKLTESDELAGENDSNETLERGMMQYGCQHYRRRCCIRAPCCNEIFGCRHCHNGVKNSINVDQKHRHDMPRHQVRQVICSLCGTEQEVRQTCIGCGVCMGKYFCGTCKLYDDDISKNQYHCDGCGICRIGGGDNFFHCDKCGCCYSVLLKNSHPCVEGAMHHDCPVCFEFLFESRSDVIVLPCGHTIHKNCLKEMRDHYQYTCPLCSKSVCDMSRVWEKFDMEIASTPMPEPYQNKMVWILCNDCGKTSQVQFHVLGQKCLHCKSYNTRQIGG